MSKSSPATRPAPRIELLDADGVRQAGEESAYLEGLLRSGPSRYIDNARVEMTAVRIDGTVLPLVLGNPELRNADSCSPYSHYVRYTLEELLKRNPDLPAWPLRVLFGAYGAGLRACSVDRVLYLNNWLFATNPHQELDADQLRRLTEFLCARCPGHALVQRSINPRLHPHYRDALTAAGFRMVRSRVVYLLDPRSERFGSSSNVKLDLQLLERSPYEVIGGEAIGESEVPRLAGLYRSLYLDKHSGLNPGLTEDFFALTLRGKDLQCRALKQAGRIDGFIMSFERGGVLTGAFIGYDRGLPRELGLYRQLVALLIAEARDRGMLLNLSAGAAVFKSLRGAYPVIEYDAVYDRHLSPRRRLAWWLLRQQGRAWGMA
jgi:hypothetical protein